MLVAFLSVTASASAGEVRLWACHGPAGTAAPFQSLAAGSSDTTVSMSDGGCSQPGGTIRIAFVRPDPADGSFAYTRIDAPIGLPFQRVRLDRRVTGPGAFARTSSTLLERQDAATTADGVVTFDADGTYVDLGLDCTTAPRCDAPSASVDLRSAALTVRDDTPPVASSISIPSPATGLVAIALPATDSGVGLYSATTSVDGQLVAGARYGSEFGRCSELSPFDGTIDLELPMCTKQGTAFMSVDTSALADGHHELQVAVLDGAGNATTKTYELEARNHPVTPTPTATATAEPTASPITLPAAVVTATPTPTPLAKPTTAALVRLPKRVSRKGVYSVSVLCPATSPRSCAHRLTLKAQGKTIATGKGSSKPGRRVQIALKLTSAARRALARERTLTATLTLSGAAPTTVRLRG
jgi:hypothetical protein